MSNVVPDMASKILAQWEHIQKLTEERDRYKAALEKIANQEPGVIAGGMSAWIATDALKAREA